MKAVKTSLLIGAAAIAAIGLAGAAVAEIKHNHVMQVRLPDGTMEEIRYTGDTPPVVRLQTGWAPIAYAWPADVFSADLPFAALEQLSAQMDQEAAALLHQARSLPDPVAWGPGRVAQVDLGELPPGTSGYAMVSTMTGGQVCTRTVRYGPSRHSGRLTAITQVSGDCDGPPQAAPSTQAVSAPEPARQAVLQQVSTRS